jgi:hypothetical protein
MMNLEMRAVAMKMSAVHLRVRVQPQCSDLCKPGMVGGGAVMEVPLCFRGQAGLLRHVLIGSLS